MSGIVSKSISRNSVCVNLCDRVFYVGKRHQIISILTQARPPSMVDVLETSRCTVMGPLRHAALTDNYRQISQIRSISARGMYSSIRVE